MIVDVTALDLGNAGTRAAHVSARESSVLVASNGKTWITTAIARQGTQWIVGEDAANFVRENPDRGVIGLKQLLRSGAQTARIAGTEYDVRALIGEFVRLAFPQLVDLSKQAPMVVTYPTDSGEYVRQATIAAIRASGATLLLTPGSNKPFTCDEALALAIASVQEVKLNIAEGSHLYCADHGHVTGDDTMLVAKKHAGGQIELHPHAWRGSPEMGGSSIDDAIVNYMRVTHNAPVDKNPHAATMAARILKTRMSDTQATEARFIMPLGYSGDNKPVCFEQNMTRDEFHAVLQPVRTAIHNVVREIVEQTNKPDAVIIGGGLSNLPEIAQFIGEATDCKNIHVIEHPEIATVKGAALYGAMFLRIKPDAIVVQPIVRRDVVVSVTDEDQIVAIPAGTPIPTEPVDIRLDRNVERFRIAEATAPDSVCTTTTPYFVNLTDGGRFVRITADVTGITLQRGKDAKSLKPIDIEWTHRPMVDEFMQNLAEVAHALTGKGC